MGNNAGVGATIRFSATLSNCTYSSKVREMLLSLNPLLESGGSAFTSMGGSESVGPPVGGIILAQPECRTKISGITKRVIRKKKRDFFIKFFRAVLFANINGLLD